MFMLPRRRKAFARGLRFAAMMHQHHDMLFRASHVNARLIFEQVAAKRGICSADLQGYRTRQRSRSLTARLTKARRRDSG